MHKVTTKKAKYLFNRLIEDEIEEILFPKFVQSTLDNYIKLWLIIIIFCINYLFLNPDKYYLLHFDEWIPDYRLNGKPYPD